MKSRKCGTKRALCGILAFSFCLFLLSAHFSPSFASKNPKRELKKIEKRLRTEKRKIEQAIEKEKSILTEIENTNKALRKKHEELKHYNKRLTNTNSEIDKLNEEILLLDKKLGDRKDILKTRLRSLYKQQHGIIADVLISARDYHDLIKKIRYISFIADHDNRLIESYNSGMEELSGKMARLEGLRKDLESSRKKIRIKTVEMKKEREKKDQLLASIKSKRGSYEKMVKELEESSKNLRELIKKIEIRKKAARYAGKGFGKQRGRLPWPVVGKVLVPFGRHNDPEYNIPTFRKGIEIKADLGTAVLAVAGGRVVYADWFKGYGLLVIVDHGDGYHTLYANLSEIFHKTGDIIKRRQAVGKAGESGVLNVPSLYFEIRHKGKPVDPLKWLRNMKN